MIQKKQMNNIIGCRICCESSCEGCNMYELEKALDLADFYKSVITVSIDGKSEKVVCKDVQFHPVSDAPIHVDFLRK